MNLVVFWIIFAFIIWISVFFGFLSAQLAFSSDAGSYFDHIKFFIENLAKGVFPLWDPYWYFGSPNDFFLRRIGAFNPFYSIISILEFFKFPFKIAYPWFLALYYWGGMIAFYLLAKRIYNNRLIAYSGYLMLLFSALGTRLFDSYMMLVTVPLIWFFYFLIAFSQTMGKSYFFGMCLSFMILAGTYIPFYFLICFFIFLVFYLVFYFKEIPEIFRRFFSFFKANKILVVLSLGLVLFSFVPLVTFFHDSAQGNIVLPERHGGIGAVGNTLIVPHQTLNWGAVEDLVFSAFFSDLRTYKLAIVYVPFCAFIILALGLIARVSRRALLMFLCGFVLFCSIVPYGLSLYDFLYKHIFFLKYFRNLHFFLWFFLIPLFVLLVLEHWKAFCDIKPLTPMHKNVILTYVVLIHALAFLFVWSRADAIPSTYLMMFLSLVFWVLMVLGKIKENAWVFAFLTLIILIQPLEVFHYLCLRAQHYNKNFSQYNFSYSTLKLKDSEVPAVSILPSDKMELYYASSNYNLVYHNMSNYALAKYLQYKFILVDHLEAIERNQVDFSQMERLYIENPNKAYIFQDKAVELITESKDPNPPRSAQRISHEDLNFKVLSFNANRLKVSVVVPYAKFLIYNDVYDPSWHVSVNGHPSHLYQANVAFKGVWIPAGKSIVEFHYGHFGQYAMNFILLIGAFAFLFGIIRYSYEIL